MGSARRALSSLPCRLGGLGVANPTLAAMSNYETAIDSTKVLREAIISGTEVDHKHHQAHMITARKRAEKRMAKDSEETIRTTLPRLPIHEQLGFIMAYNEGPTTFLSSNPKITNQLLMTAEEYRDALGLASGYTPPNLPSSCRGCGKVNPDFRHLMQCRVGGANKIRHNEYATVWANTLELAGYNPVALEVPVPHPPGPPGLPEPDVPLRTDVTARGIFEVTTRHYTL